MKNKSNKVNLDKGVFGSLDPKAEIFKKLKEQQPKWWLLFLEDEELYIDIRKDNYINVYYYGGSLAKIEYKKDFVASIHKKYLGINHSGYTKLDLDVLTKKEVDKIKEQIKINYLKGNPEKPAEKKIQGKLILENPNFIDSEFQYNRGVENLRIDLIELSDGQLSFVELKGITDNRLRNDETRNKETPEIIEQMTKYREFINEYATEIINYYKQLIKLKNDLGIFKHNENFILEKTPRLLIVNTYNKLTKGREERIDAIENLLNKHKIEYEIVKL